MANTVGPPSGVNNSSNQPKTCAQQCSSKVVCSGMDKDSHRCAKLVNNCIDGCQDAEKATARGQSNNGLGATIDKLTSGLSGSVGVDSEGNVTGGLSYDGGGNAPPQVPVSASDLATTALIAGAVGVGATVAGAPLAVAGALALGAGAVYSWFGGSK